MATDRFTATALSELENDTDFVVDTDSRLSDARTPRAHGASHLGGSDDLLASLDARYLIANVVAFQSTGTGDDTAAWQALVAELVADGGGVIRPIANQANPIVLSECDVVSGVHVLGFGGGDSYIKQKTGARWALRTTNTLGAPSTSSVQRPIITDVTIDQNLQPGAGLLLEACWHAKVDVNAINVPAGTWTYNDGAGTVWVAGTTYAAGSIVVGSNASRYEALVSTTGNDPTTDGGIHWTLVTGVYPACGIMVKGITGTSGAYYNELDRCEVSGVSALSHANMGIVLTSTTQTSSNKANDAELFLPRTFYCDTGINVLNGNDVTLYKPEVSQNTTGISIRSQRTHIEKPYIETCTTGIFIDAAAAQTRIMGRGSTASTVTLLVDNGIQTMWLGLDYGVITWAGGAFVLSTQGDREGTIIATAAGTITLPSGNDGSARAFKGRRYHFANKATSGYVTISPVAGTLIGGKASLILAPGDAVIIVSDGTDWQIIADRRAQRRIETLADAAAIALSADYDGGKIAELSQATTITAPAGAPTSFQTYILKLKSTASRALTWTGFRAGTDVALPLSNTGGGKTDRLVFIWDSDASTWDLVGLVRGF